MDLFAVLNKRIQNMVNSHNGVDLLSSLSDEMQA